MKIYNEEFVVNKNIWYKINIIFESVGKGLLKIFDKTNTNQLFPSVSFPNDIFMKSNTEYNIFYFNKNEESIVLYGLGYFSKINLTKVDISNHIDVNKIKDIPDPEFAIYYMKAFNKTGHSFNKIIDNYKIMKEPDYINKMLTIEKVDIRHKSDKRKMLIIFNNISYLCTWLNIVNNILVKNTNYKFIFVGDKLKDFPNNKFIKIKEYLNLENYTITEYINMMSNRLKDIIIKEDIDTILTNDIYIAALYKIGPKFILIDTDTYSILDEASIKLNDSIKDYASLYITHKEESGDNINKFYIPYSFDSSWQTKIIPKNNKIKVGYIGFDTKNNLNNILTLLRFLNGKGFIINLILSEPISNRQLDNYKKSNTIIITIVSDYTMLIKYCKLVNVFIFMPEYNGVNILNTTGLCRPIICHNSFTVIDIPLRYSSVEEIPKLLLNINNYNISYGVLSDISISDKYLTLLDNI